MWMNLRKCRCLFFALITFLCCFWVVKNAGSTITKTGQWGSGPGSGPYTDIFIYNSYAYCAAGRTGIDIIDISDQTNPLIVSSFDTPGNACKVHVSGNYLYVADLDGGLKIIDISNPSLPTLKGSYDTSEFAFFMDVFVSDNYAYVSVGIEGMKIIDISNPASPSLAGSYSAPGVVTDVYVSGSYAYIIDSVFGVNDSGLKAVDISNPAAPVYTKSYKSGSNSDIYVSGNHAYLANYSGRLIVLNLGISDLTSDGDLNKDSEVNLKDAIIGLNISAGMDQFVDVCLENEVNTDGKIGIEEVVYILRTVSGML